jgi:hypothetical protein
MRFEEAVDQIIRDQDQEEWTRNLDRFPPELQKEIVIERPQFTKEDLDWVKSWKLLNPNPVPVKMLELLKNQGNLDSIARCPSNVVERINRQWGLNVVPGEVYDPDPSRFEKVAKQFSGGTASPSVRINGEIVFGVGRFISALLRGDQQLRVWDLMGNWP